MARRRRSRQRRRRERRDRPVSDEQAAAPSPPPPAEPAKAAQGISWIGLIGGLMGFAPVAALGIEFLLDGRAVAAVPLLMAAIYLPAVWASLTATAQRRTVLRSVVAASIVMVFVSLPFLGPTLAVILVPATALLAIAGRLVFSR